MTSSYKAIILAAVSAITLSIAVIALGAEFKHETHLSGPAPECSICHKPEALSIEPSEEVCVECHAKDYISGVTMPPTETHGSFWYEEHKTYAKREGSGSITSNCYGCHEQGFCLDCHKGSFTDENDKANIHRSDYLVTHPIMARGDSRSCGSCHETTFCSDCHDRFNRNDLRLASHRRSWSDLAVSPGHPVHSTFTEGQCQGCHPDSLLPKHEWSDNHAREARRDIQLCSTCHEDADVCIKCHSAMTGLMANPHPSDWSSTSIRLRRASKGTTCRKCHVEGDY